MVATCVARSGLAASVGQILGNGLRRRVVLLSCSAPLPAIRMMETDAELSGKQTQPEPSGTRPAQRSACLKDGLLTRAAVSARSKGRGCSSWNSRATARERGPSARTMLGRVNGPRMIKGSNSRRGVRPRSRPMIPVENTKSPGASPTATAVIDPDQAGHTVGTSDPNCCDTRRDDTSRDDSGNGCSRSTNTGPQLRSRRVRFQARIRRARQR